MFRNWIGLFRDTQNSTKNTFFHGITKTIPNLFCEIFLVQNFDGNPTEDNSVLWEEGVVFI